jgi:hypothetical protein
MTRATTKKQAVEIAATANSCPADGRLFAAPAAAELVWRLDESSILFSPRTDDEEVWPALSKY